jgi:hypothetical protein
MGEGKPRDQLRARRPAARDAVADRRPNRLPGHPVPHPSAKTSTLAGIAVHPFSLPFSVPATILAARRNLFAVPNLGVLLYWIIRLLYWPWKSAGRGVH